MMKYKILGNTGLKVSTLCLGTMNFGGKGFFGYMGTLDQKELHTFLGLSSPLNPLITIIDHAQMKILHQTQKLLFEFYNATIKKNFKGVLKYGKTNYDFDEGTMSFLAPAKLSA
jgi:hypothetical protein